MSNLDRMKNGKMFIKGLEIMGNFKEQVTKVFDKADGEINKFKGKVSGGYDELKEHLSFKLRTAKRYMGYVKSENEFLENDDILFDGQRVCDDELYQKEIKKFNLKLKHCNDLKEIWAGVGLSALVTASGTGVAAIFTNGTTQNTLITCSFLCLATMIYSSLMSSNYKNKSQIAELNKEKLGLGKLLFEARAITDGGEKKSKEFNGAVNLDGTIYDDKVNEEINKNKPNDINGKPLKKPYVKPDIKVTENGYFEANYNDILNIIGGKDTTTAPDGTRKAESLDEREVRSRED